MKFPSFGSLDTVRNRKVPAFLGIQIFLAMGIPGIKDTSFKSFDLLHYFWHDRYRFFRSQRSVNKIILHIYYH